VVSATTSGAIITLCRSKHAGAAIAVEKDLVADAIKKALKGEFKGHSGPDMRTLAPVPAFAPITWTLR